jgi:protocatechuate 3,4-dioxygenase beta subunit
MERASVSRFEHGRRGFLRAGLGAVTAAGLVLRADAQPTPAIRRARGDEDQVVEVQLGPIPALEPRTEALRAVVPLPYGPFYRAGAPFRGKLSLPGEPGTTFVLNGRVWDVETRRPIPGAVLDLWHVDTSERYSDGVGDLRNRGRVLASESGAYEVESIRPIPYRPSASSHPDFWRCAHFHLLVRCPGYAPLVTEIHFQDEAHKEDEMYTPANAIAVETHERGGQRFQSGVFDVVLRRE